DRAERARELRVDDRVRCDEVHRALDLGVEQVTEGADLVVEADPRLPLPPRADAAAEAQLEGEELATEGTLLRVEHDAGARVHRADAPCRGEPRARLPAHAEVG